MTNEKPSAPTQRFPYRRHGLFSGWLAALCLVAFCACTGSVNMGRDAGGTLDAADGFQDAGPSDDGDTDGSSNNEIIPDYYVSLSGDDSNGLSEATAWNSLKSLEAQIGLLEPGDVIGFKGGDEFFGNLTIQNCPGITLASYGSGKAIIKGVEAIGGWNLAGENIWKAPTYGKPIFNVFKDGAQLKNGRYPKITGFDFENANYATVTSVQNSTNTFTSADLIGFDDLTGATVRLRTLPFRRETRIITAFGSATGQIGLDADTVSNIDPGETFWVQNHQSLVSTQNEWYFNEATEELFLYSSSSPTGIEVVTSEHAGIEIIASGDVAIENLAIWGFYSSGIALYESSDPVVKNNRITNIHGSGIHFLTSHRALADGNEIRDIGHKGIIFENTNNAIAQDNRIEDICLLKHFLPGSFSGASAIYNSYHSLDTIIRRNQIRNIGYNGVSFYNSRNLVIENNYIENTCLNMEDGGAIYGQNAEGDGSIGSVHGNILIETVVFDDPEWDRVGIYIDDNGHDFTLSRNSIHGFRRGIFMHNTDNCNVSNNNLYKTIRGSILYKDDVIDASGTSSGNSLTGNQIYLENATQPALKIHNTLHENWDFVETLDNNCYFNPLNPTSVTLVTTTVDQEYTLSEWQAFTDQESSSSDNSAIMISDSQFLYNDSDVPVVFNVTGPWWNLDGEPLPDRLTIQPYRSEILIRHQ